ncbi:trimeric autotransporter adhesin Ata [Acinetobacter baumannii]|nr:trimeric autotransporter adhesin Ata [Acinetobacter baumannii]
MNKVYKVIWNASIGAWVATSEIAKSKTKTKSKTLNISAAVLSGVICFAPNAFAGTNTEGGVGQGTSISGTTSCREGSANTANQKDIAIGCGAQTQDRTGSNIANRNNPYNNSTGAYAGAMKQGGAISVGTGAVVEKGLGTAIGSYATTQGISGVAIGTGALSSGNTALAVGRQSAATADFSQAIGNVAAATGKGSLAIGHSATAEGYRSIAIGSPDIENADPVAGQAGAAYQPKMATKATGKDSIAFGGGAIATEENALAIGAFSESKGKKSVAIGTGAKAQKDNAVVIGDQAEASFEGGVAIGKGARSEAENSIALGKDSKASQATGESFLTKQSAPTGVLSIGDIGTERRIQNVADGAADSDAATVRQLKAARTHYVSINDNGQQGGNFENDGATGRNAIAVGVNASAAGREAMAIGGSAQAIGSGAIAMGSSSQTVGRGDVAIGRNASTQGAEGVNSNQSVAIGDQTKAIGDQSVAIGADVIAKGNSSVAIGGDDVDKIARDTELSKTYTEITGGTLQAGKYPTTEANHGSTAVGVQAVGTGAFSSAFGMTSKATGDASSAFGVMSNASGKGAAAFGAVAQATGDGASAMGINSLASGTNSTAIGSGNKPGEGAKATGNSSAAIGSGAQATGDNSAAIGSGAQATGDNSAAIGKGAEATNENAAAVGGGAKATGKNAAAIGGGAIADQENAVAVGQGAQSLVEGGVALGARSKVEAKNSVALGQDAVATEATGTSFLTNRDASQSNGVISVGSAGKERRITNVEDGSADSDAVTVRQLKNVDSRVNQNTSNIGKNTQNITNLNQKLDDTKTNLGNQITDTNKNLNDAKKDLGIQITDTNTKLNTTKDQLTTQINDTKTELNNTIGNTKTELNTKIDNTKTELENKGLNFAGNSGADVHRKLGDKLNIVGGAAASAPAAKTSGENIITRTTQDGIQIELLKDSKFDSVTTGNTTLNTNGLTIKEGPSITKQGINAGSKQITNVADGINAKDAVNVDQLTKVKENLNGRITDTNNQLNDAKKDLGNQIADTNKNLNDAKKDLGDQITDTNTKLNNTKDQLTTQINDTKTELNNTIGNTKTELNSKIDSTKTELENKGLNFAGNSGSDVHRKLGEKLNIVGGAAASTPAAKTSGENVITRTTKDGIQIELLKDSKFDSVTTGNTTLNTNGLTIKEGASITKDGINAGGKQITNVADGINAKDAVNKSQLDNLAAKQNATDDAAVKYDDAKTKDKVTLKGKDGTVLDNVKAGHISSTSKEAVNGSQIHKISNSIKNSIGGNTVVNPDGSLTTSNIGGTGKNNINDAISEVKNTAKKAKTTVTEGDNIVVKETVNKDGSTNYEVSTKKDLTLNSVTTGDSVLNNNGLTIKDGPSITKDGINAGGKKITDVANGVIAQNSKDAVNGAQVHHISNSIKNSIGGNTVVNPDGSLMTNNIGGTGKNNINDAIKSVDEKVTNGVNDLTQKGLNFGANDQKTTQGKAVHRKLGDTINIVGGADAKTAEDKTSGENIITRTTEDGVKIEMLKDVKFDSVNVGGHVLNQQGLIIKGGPSITVNGINAGGKQITNVADGINAKDAVNKGQLDKKINEVKDQIGKDIGKLSDHAVQYDKDKNGNVDKNSVTLGGGEKGTNLKNVADGKIAEGSKDAVNGGQLWNVQNQVDKNSNDIKNIQNNIDNISNGKAGLVQQQKPNGEITVGKDTGGTSINMAGKEGDRVVQGIKDGEIKAGSNQAVNGGQIHKISESIKNSIGGNTTIDPKDGSITTNNIGGTGKNNINDAIGMLNQSNQELGNKITNLGDQLQQVFYDTNKRIDDVEKKANAGIAAAMALENAPFVAGKYTYAVGAAYHGGENAVGVTLRKTSDNGRWSITGGVAAASQGEPSVRVGISGVIN